MTASDRILTKFFIEKMNEFGMRQSSYQEGYTDAIDRCDQKIGACCNCAYSKRGICQAWANLPTNNNGYCHKYKDDQ